MEVPAPDCQATQLEEALREDLRPPRCCAMSVRGSVRRRLRRMAER